MNKCSQVNQVIGGRVVDFTVSDFTVLKVLYSKSTVKCSIFNIFTVFKYWIKVKSQV